MSPAPATHQHRIESKSDGGSFMEVPGARLYYELRGSGPVLVLIPGAAGFSPAIPRPQRSWSRTSRQ